MLRSEIGTRLTQSEARQRLAALEGKANQPRCPRSVFYRCIITDRPSPCSLACVSADIGRGEMPMRLKSYCLAGLAALLTMWATAVATHAAGDGLITKPSRYSVSDTIARFEAAVRQRETDGLMVFTEIDHAAAAKKFGLEMRPRTVILFGTPKRGTPTMV